MPRIQAPTVADHRARQRQALVDAARGLLEESGDSAAVTFAAVAARTGLARNSVYKYFDGRHELLAAVVADVVPAWMDAIREAMEAAADPGAKVAAFVRAQLEMVRCGGHRVAQALSGGPDSVALRESGAQAHRALLAPLMGALADLGEEDPRRTAMLLQGIVNAATSAVEAGDDFAAVTDRAVRLAVAGITGVVPAVPDTPAVPGVSGTAAGAAGGAPGGKGPGAAG